MSNMFIRHRTSVALLCRLADRSRPGICIWAGIMFIASGWRIKKGKKKKLDYLIQSVYIDSVD